MDHSRLAVRAAALTLALAAAAGCSKPDRVEKGPASSAIPAARTTTDVTITSENGSVVLALVADTVAMQLSDSVRASVDRELDSAATKATGRGIGAQIERAVTSGVRTMLSKRIAQPLDEIEDVRYEDGTIIFEYTGRRPMMSFESVKVDNRPVLAHFKPDDARRFVAAVRAAKGKP